MLCQLSIRNIALIEDLTIEFTQGLNVLTGETGAGKSIVIDAMNLALGERADRDLIRAGQEKARASIEESLRKLQTDYIDLLLIHQPFNDYYGTWRAMEEAYKAGKVRAIGVSNFFPDRLVDLCQFVEIRPMVNQVETHALYQQKAAHAIMEKYGVVHELSLIHI